MIFKCSDMFEQLIIKYILEYMAQGNLQPTEINFKNIITFS